MATIALTLLMLLLTAPVAHARSWQPPVHGPLLRGFSLGADPYARGWHRGVDLGASAGSPVRSACAGRVAFSGRVPGGGRTVSVRCGAMIATYQQLAAIAVRARERVAPGTRLGSVGPSADPRTRRPHVHLGAREARSGRYVDPLSLLGGGRPGVPLLPPPAPRGHAPERPVAPRIWPGPAPVPALPRPAPLGHTPASARPRMPATRPVGAARRPPAVAAAPAPAPGWPVWAGLASIGLALPLGGLLTARRRRRPPRPAVAPAR